MADVIAYLAQRLHPNGKIAINLVLIERVTETIELLNQHGFASSVSQVSIARSRPLQSKTFLAALNPVFVVAATRV